MKQRLLFFLGVLLNATLVANAAMMAESSEIKESGRSVVELQAALHSGTLRSSSGEPIQAIFDAYILEILYLQDIESLSVEITDEFGNIVYKESSGNRNSGSITQVNISDWKSRSYFIKFYYIDGGLIYGSFEL